MNKRTRQEMPICMRLRSLSNEVAHSQIADQIVDDVAPMAADMIEELTNALEWALGQLPPPRLVRGTNDAYYAAYQNARAILSKAAEPVS